MPASALYDYPYVQDIHAWTHEIGEIFNNPFLTNATPAWGHIGQTIACQADLEVGDPLTFESFEHTYNGFHYHPQELAFFSWFYRTASTGTGDLLVQGNLLQYSRPLSLSSLRSGYSGESKGGPGRPAI